MKERLRRRLALLLLRALNRVLATHVRMDDILAIRVLANENVHFGQHDVDSIRLLLKERLHFRPDKVGLIRFVLGEGAGLKQEDVEDLARFACLCYSQEGESLVLERLFESRNTGFYVDVGAHHPKRFSNTYSLYKRGWRGINIDPNPGAADVFQQYRPDDTFVAAAVLRSEGAKDFYMFAEPALNTFNKPLAEQYQRAGHGLVEVRPIGARTLSSVLAQCGIAQPIDLLSIDVEGHELDVLQSNDWGKYRPEIVLVEILDFDLSRPEGSAVHKFMCDQGYALLAKTYNTVFYKARPVGR